MGERANSVRRPAQAEIEFARAADGTTFVAHSRVGYPFHLGRRLELPGDPPDMASVCLQSCSGGLFAHDRVAGRFVAREGARAHVSTGAATIVHSMPAGEATQQLEIVARDGALIEYLPGSTILFPGARISTRLTLRLEGSGVVVAGEAWLPHDPGGGTARFERLESVTEVCDADGRLLAGERMRLHGAAPERSLAGVFGRWRAQALLLVAVRDARTGTLLDALRAALTASSGVYGGASLLPNRCGAWLRLLAPDAIALRTGWHMGWAAVRAVLTDWVPGPRRW